MLTISDLLDLNQVRSILTVSPVDLPDEVLRAYGLEDDIVAILDRRLEDWQALTEERHRRNLRIFTKFKAASILAGTAQLFVLKKSSDGNNEGQRSDRDGFDDLPEKLNAKAEEALADILEDLGHVTERGIELVGVSKPFRDPITEPRENVSR